MPAIDVVEISASTADFSPVLATSYPTTTTTTFWHQISRNASTGSMINFNTSGEVLGLKSYRSRRTNGPSAPMRQVIEG